MGCGPEIGFPQADTTPHRAARPPPLRALEFCVGCSRPGGSGCRHVDRL